MIEKGAVVTIDEMTVLAGMPVPVRPCPAANPVTLDTPVRVGLPLVVMPVNETSAERTCPTARLALLVMVTAVLTVAVAFADIVIVVPLIALMAVLAGMPAPVSICPTARLVLLVMVSAVLTVAVAFADIVIVVPLSAMMVVLAGMPAPVRTCPTANPVRLDTLVREALPEVVMAVNEKVLATLVREALPEVVMAVNEKVFDTLVREALALVVMAVNEIVGPAMTCPTTTPVTFVTFVMTLLPAVTVPVGVTTLLAVAGCDIVTVLAPIAVMVAPGLMPGAVSGCPTANPNPAVPGTPAALVT